MLIAAGTAAITHTIEIALAIGVLLAIVTFSYRQTIKAIVGGKKFNEGAWISMIAMFALAIAFFSIYRHYTGVERQLHVPSGALMETGTRHRQTILVPVDELNRSVLRTVDYARSLSPNVTALHVTDDREREGERLRDEWEHAVLDVPFVLIESPTVRSSRR